MQEELLKIPQQLEFTEVLLHAKCFTFIILCNIHMVVRDTIVINPIFQMRKPRLR